MRKPLSALVLVSVSMLLLGCSSAGSVDTSPTGDAGSADILGPVPAPEVFDFDLITSCDEVEGAMAPYIEGLVAADQNSVDEYGASCMWTMPEGNTDWANAREVDLGITPVSPGEPAPDLALLEKMDGFTRLDSEWLAARDGIAYAFGMTTGVIGGVATTVWTPEYQLSVGGGHWEGFPSLDAHAALEVAKSILG